MELLDTPDGAWAWSGAQRAAGQRIAFVPTMGALHDGHRRLIDTATGHGDVVAVSIFVNPLQFNRRDDYDAYPRPADDDLAVCAAAGVAAVYAPTVAAMYPSRFQTHVEPGDLAEPLEGSGRPGHFRGVATVVTKLFNAIRPDVAIFGEKDFQQLAIIRRMVADLDLGIEIVGMPTVREADGLAMSSRNRRLDPADRAAAVVVVRALRAMQQAASDGVTEPRRLEDIGRAVIESEPRARLEYLRVADPLTLQPPIDVRHGAQALAAVWFGEVRLIDNLRLV